MTYTLQMPPSTGVVRDEDGAFIPDEPCNADWRTYQAWLAAGNAATPASAPPPAPIAVQMWQAKAALKAAAFSPSQAQDVVLAVVANATNLLDAADALIAASGDVPLQAFWEYASQLQSNNATIAALGAEFGLPPAQIAALFAAAAALSF